MSNNRPKILISACLLGDAVRYDGTDLKQQNRLLEQWLSQDRVVSICPEVSGGLPVPRVPAEIQGREGIDVMTGSVKVINRSNEDVTENFIQGAEKALSVCKANGIKVALLTERSPSCGGQEIYNGKFTKTKISGEGVTTALLRKNDIQVFNQSQWEEANAALLTCE